MELAESGASKLRSVVSPSYGLYRQQVAMLILHPNGVKNDMGEYNVSRPVEKDAELNESFDLENSGSSLNFKGQQLPWRSTALSRQVIIVSH